MPKNKPEYTSTPNAMPRVLGRRGIKDQSALQSSSRLLPSSFSRDTSDASLSNEQINHDSADDDYEENEEGKSNFVFGTTGCKVEGNRRKEWYISESINVEKATLHHSTKEGSLTRQPNFNCIKVAIVILIFAVLLKLLLSSSHEDKLNLDDLIKVAQQNFSKQDSNFWPSVKVNIREILELKRPRTILFLYMTHSELTVRKVVDIISKIGVCYLTSCSKIPVTISGLSLAKPEFTEDYGKVISQYQANLTDSGVMVVNNIEEIPGVVAQAFHSICDDYNSVEKRALILLTMAMDEISGTHSSLLDSVEQKLQKLWTDISLEDVFQPLFTRITSTVLHIHSEEFPIL